MRISLDTLQDQHQVWSKYNWGGQRSWAPLMGMVEELGELAHSHLKRHQGIRYHEDLDRKGQDAVGDILIYAAHYCNTQEWSMQQLLDETWMEVRERDWIQNPDTGVIQPSQSKYPWTRKAA